MVGPKFFEIENLCRQAIRAAQTKYPVGTLLCCRLGKNRKIIDVLSSVEVFRRVTVSQVKGFKHWKPSSLIEEIDANKENLQDLLGRTPLYDDLLGTEEGLCGGEASGPQLGDEWQFTSKARVDD